MKGTESKYESEAAMCAAFIAWAKLQDWCAYPETGGWDVLLVRADGYQIGVQAKQSLNLGVICQAIEAGGDYEVEREGPDFRAVLTPRSKMASQFAQICQHAGLTIVTAAGPGSIDERGYVRRLSQHGYFEVDAFGPRLPCAGDVDSWRGRDDKKWFERLPAKRVALPDYVPDVAAGASAPLQLTAWKIKAIKIAIILELRGFVTRGDFKQIGIDHRLWIENWLIGDAKLGGWVSGPRTRDFKAEHPVNYEEIKADREKWWPASLTLAPAQRDLLGGAA